MYLSDTCVIGFNFIFKTKKKINITFLCVIYHDDSIYQTFAGLIHPVVRHWTLYNRGWLYNGDKYPTLDYARIGFHVIKQQ